MRTTIGLSDDDFKKLIALGSFISVTERGGIQLTQGEAVKVALDFYFDNNPKVKEHEKLLDGYTDKKIYRNKKTGELYILVKTIDEYTGTFCMVKDNYNYTIPFEDMDKPEA